MRYLFLFLAFVVPLLFVACGDDGGNDWPPKDPDWWRGVYLGIMSATAVLYFIALIPKRKRR